MGLTVCIHSHRSSPSCVLGASVCSWLVILQACEHYSQAFELDPEDESAVLNRAITRALLRKVPEALQDFSEALRLNPYSSHVFFNRANLYSSLRQYRNAEKDLSQGEQ